MHFAYPCQGQHTYHNRQNLAWRLLLFGFCSRKDILRTTPICGRCPESTVQKREKPVETKRPMTNFFTLQCEFFALSSLGDEPRSITKHLSLRCQKKTHTSVKNSNPSRYISGSSNQLNFIELHKESRPRFASKLAAASLPSP